MIDFRERMNQFYSLGDNEWKSFVAIWKPVEIKKRVILTRRGEIEQNMYFVRQGVLRGFYKDERTEFTGGFSYEGDFSGIPDSFLNQTPSMYFLETLSPCKVLKAKYAQLKELYKSSVEFERFGRIMAEKMLLGLNTRFVELQCYSAEERFKVFLNRSPHLLQKIPQKYLASYLGMTPETFSRLIRKVRI